MAVLLQYVHGCCSIFENSYQIWRAHFFLHTSQLLLVLPTSVSRQLACHENLTCKISALQLTVILRNFALQKKNAILYYVHHITSIFTHVTTC